MRKDGDHCWEFKWNCPLSISIKRPSFVVHSAEGLKGLNRFDCLPDELLGEILYRRHCSKSVIQCKCVCKRWCTLISQPEFIREFDKRNISQSYHFLFRMRPNRIAVDKNAFLYKNEFLFSLENHSLSLISGDGDGTTDRFLGACHDLGLYCRDNEATKSHEFCIRNIQTKQKIQLPSSPFYYTVNGVCGFVCDPPGKGNDNSTCRYSVAVVHTTEYQGTEFPVHLLLSTNGNKWCEKVLSLPKTCKLCPTVGGLAINGKHFFGSYQGALFIDPYPEESNNVIKCPLIAWPPNFKLGARHVGVCNGNLLISYISFMESKLVVWLLKDCQTSEWSLVHNLAIQDLVSIDPLLYGRPFNKPWSVGYVLGFHPSNPDFIYTLTATDILLWDVRNKTLKLVNRIDLNRGTNEFGHFAGFYVSLTSIPTPLATIESARRALDEN